MRVAAASRWNQPQYGLAVFPFGCVQRRSDARAAGTSETAPSRHRREPSPAPRQLGVAKHLIQSTNQDVPPRSSFRPQPQGHRRAFEPGRRNDDLFERRIGKKAMNRLSRNQNGLVALSVPASATISTNRATSPDLLFPSLTKRGGGCALRRNPPRAHLRPLRKQNAHPRDGCGANASDTAQAQPRCQQPSQHQSENRKTLRGGAFSATRIRDRFQLPLRPEPTASVLRISLEASPYYSLRLRRQIRRKYRGPAGRHFRQR